MKKRVEWTDAEWNKVVNEAFRLRFKRPFQPVTKLIDSVIKQLPVERRRSAMSVRVELERRLKIKMADAYEKLTTSEDLERRYRDVKGKSVEELIRDHDPNQVLEMLPLAQVAGYATSKLLTEWTELKSQLQKEERSRVQKENKEPEQETKKKPRVLLVGFKREQVKIVRSKIKVEASVFELPKSRSHMPVGNYDLAIIWTDFVSHTMTDSSKGCNYPVRWFSGGLNKAIEIISEALYESS